MGCRRRGTKAVHQEDNSRTKRITVIGRSGGGAAVVALVARATCGGGGGAARTELIQLPPNHAALVRNSIRARAPHVLATSDRAYLPVSPLSSSPSGGFTFFRILPVVTQDTKRSVFLRGYPRGRLHRLPQNILEKPFQWGGVRLRLLPRAFTVTVASLTRTFCQKIT